MNIKGKVLVTGATGAVALHCIAQLLKNGYEVVGHYDQNLVKKR